LLEGRVGEVKLTLKKQTEVRLSGHGFEEIADFAHIIVGSKILEGSQRFGIRKRHLLLGHIQEGDFQRLERS
jgi:hypothetical protein